MAKLIPAVRSGGFVKFYLSLLRVKFFEPDERATFLNRNSQLNTMNTKLNLHKVTRNKTAFNSLSRTQRAITTLWQPSRNPDITFNMNLHKEGF